MQTLLETLCALPAVSGCEYSAADAAAELLAQHCDVTRDPLGSVIGTRSGKGPHILLDAHLDQIGMVVTGYEPGGFLHVAKCGAMDVRCLAAQAVTIHGKQAMQGVIPAGAPHLGNSDKAPDWKDVVIDTGLSEEACRELIPLGSRVCLNAPPVRLLGERFASPALDNRAGVASILRCLELLQGNDLPGVDTPSITVLFSVQEETGGAGAQAAALAAKAAEAIVVDVTFAAAPGISRGAAQGELGSGVLVGIAPTLDHEMSQRLLRTAKEHDIPHLPEIMGGASGTNADRIQAPSGTPCALLSIPQRNMHTAAEVVDIQDIEATAKLMAAYITERRAHHA